SGVVDEHVQRLTVSQERVGARPHRGQRTEVEREKMKRRVAGLIDDLLDRRACLALRAAGHEDPAAARRQLPRHRLADAAVGTGHEVRLAVEIAHRGGAYAAMSSAR